MQTFKKKKLQTKPVNIKMQVCLVMHDCGEYNDKSTLVLIQFWLCKDSNFTLLVLLWIIICNSVGMYEDSLLYLSPLLTFNSIDWKIVFL